MSDIIFPDDEVYFVRESLRKDLDDLIKTIHERYKSQPQEKLKYIEKFINKRPWINGYLLDGMSCISQDERDGSWQWMHSHYEVERIKKKVEEAGSSINYLKKRFEYHPSTYINKEGKNLLDLEADIVEFLNGLKEKVEEIEAVELNQGAETIREDVLSSVNRQLLPPFLLALGWDETKTVDEFKNIIDHGKGTIFTYKDFKAVLETKEQITVLPPNASDNIIRLFMLLEDGHYISSLTSSFNKIKENFKRQYKDSKKVSIRPFTSNDLSRVC